MINLNIKINFFFCRLIIFLNNRFQRLTLLAFDFMVRIKYYKGYVEPGGSIFKGVRYVGGGGLTYYIYEVTIIT